MNVLPFPGRAFHANRPALQPCQFLHQRQPDSAALVGAPVHALDAVEALE